MDLAFLPLNYNVSRELKKRASDTTGIVDRYLHPLCIAVLVAVNV
jgi:hypothetical protein